MAITTGVIAILLAITTFVLDKKRKIWIKNDEWLEEHRNEIMESVLVYDRFQQQFERQNNAAAKTDQNKERTFSGIFDEEDMKMHN